MAPLPTKPKKCGATRAPPCRHAWPRAQPRSSARTMLRRVYATSRARAARHKRCRACEETTAGALRVPATPLSACLDLPLRSHLSAFVIDVVSRTDLPRFDGLCLLRSNLPAAFAFSLSPSLFSRSHDSPPCRRATRGSASRGGLVGCLSSLYCAGRGGRGTPLATIIISFDLRKGSPPGYFVGQNLLRLFSQHRAGRRLSTVATDASTHGTLRISRSRVPRSTLRCRAQKHFC